jgi:transposase
MKRISIPNAETLVAAIQDEISRTMEGRYFHRLDVILHVLQRASPYDTACLFGHSPRIIEYWLHRLLSDGLAGLWEGNRSGRPSRISATNLQKLQNELRSSPRDFGYSQDLWDGVLLSHHLAEKYSISLSVRQCQRLFHKPGFSLQRPRRRASEARPELKDAFKKLLPVDERPQRAALDRTGKIGLSNNPALR